MKTIDQEREQGRKGCVMLFLVGLIILASVLFFLAWWFTDNKPKIEPQATLLPDKTIIELKENLLKLKADITEQMEIVKRNIVMERTQ